MNDFASKISNYINSDANKSNCSTGVKEDYLKLFFKMQPIGSKIADFKNFPAGFFENFDYDIYDKDYCTDDTDYSKFNYNIAEKFNLVVLINGYFSKENSKIISKNITVMSLAEKSKKEYFATEKYFLDYSESYESQFTVLSNILAKDGVYLQIHQNSVVEEPIYIVNVITKQDKNYFFNHRKLIVADENSSAKIIETDLFMSDYKSLILSICLMQQAKNSQLNYSRIKSDINSDHKKHSNANFITGYEFRLNENAKLNHNNVNFDADFGRSRTHFFLDGENAEVNTTMFSYLQNDRIVDVATSIVHSSPNTYSNQLVKAIADDNSSFSFDGKILVAQDSQKIKASQNSRAILLSDNAQVNCQPQLEIYADDVECSHGSAIGNLEEDLIFYLNSRGISKEQANKLLLTAFAAEVINRIPYQSMRDFIFSDLAEQI